MEKPVYFFKECTSLYGGWFQKCSDCPFGGISTYDALIKYVATYGPYNSLSIYEKDCINRVLITLSISKEQFLRDVSNYINEEEEQQL